MDIDISVFEITSYDEVYRLWEKCEGVGLSTADSQEAIHAYLERNPGMSFIAKSGGNVVASILGGHDGRRGYIHHLAVQPNFRRQGLATQLVNKCQEILQKEGIKKCHIFIFNNNTGGIKFWESAGWTVRSDIGVISKTFEPVSYPV